MIYRSKYVVISVGSCPVPIVFSDLLQHAEVARPLTNGIPERVLGAGFCHIDENGRYFCYGDSVSLKVKSRDDVDSAVLNKFLGVIHDDY
jgi:hypothetical protein